MCRKEGTVCTSPLQGPGRHHSPCGCHERSVDREGHILSSQLAACVGAERPVCHWSKCHWTPVPLCLLGSSLQKMLFEAILWWGREDIRLKAADCPGDWAHWGRALEIPSPNARQSQEHVEDDRGCLGASPVCVAPALKLTLRITSFWSLLISKCSLSAHWGMF